MYMYWKRLFKSEKSVKVLLVIYMNVSKNVIYVDWAEELPWDNSRFRKAGFVG